MKPDGVASMVDDLVEIEPCEFFLQMGMLILESRQPLLSVKGRQDGPHCPRDVGVMSGHTCCSTSPNCTKANQILKQMQNLWRNQVPLCIEVLILPSCKHGRLRSGLTDVTPPYEDDGYVLLEQWTIQTVQKKPGETVVSPKNLFQALKSYLHFSQLSSWLSSSQGARPSCIGYRVSPPAEFCTTTFTQDPQLHVFPVGNIGKSTNFKVWLAYLSRMPEIPEPICHELTSPDHPCSSGPAFKPYPREALNKRSMSRSKSPHPRFEAVFQNVTGSPKLVTKSYNSTQSRQQHLPGQLSQLASIFETPTLLASNSDWKANSKESSMQSDSKDDAYGIGFGDFKTQCDVKIGHVAALRGNSSLKTLPMVAVGIEGDLRNSKFSSDEFTTGRHASNACRRPLQSSSLYAEYYEDDDECLGNYYDDKSLLRDLKSNHYELPCRNYFQTFDEKCENVSMMIDKSFESPRVTKSSRPINIITNEKKLGIKFAQIILNDPSVTDSENSCSPDIDLLLTETLENMVEPMNPEEMHEFILKLYKNKQSKHLSNPLNDHISGVHQNFQDLVNENYDINKDLNNLMPAKRRMPRDDAILCGHPSESKDACDKNIASLATQFKCLKSKSCSCFADVSCTILNHEDSNCLQNKEIFETLECLDSRKDQKSLKRLTRDQRWVEDSIDDGHERPLFEVGDDQNDVKHDSSVKLSRTNSTHLKRSQHNKTQENQQALSHIFLEDEENTTKDVEAASSLDNYFLQSSQSQLKCNTDNVTPPSSLQLLERSHQVEHTPTRPISAIPRRLQSKTPQDSKHPSLLFVESTRQNLPQQKSSDVDISNPATSSEGSKSVVSNGNGYRDDAPRIPTESEKKGFHSRVQHSSSMVFNSRTKLPMQSSPVPAKRLSAGCFDYDSSLNSVQAIKNSLSCNNLDDTENSSDGCNRLREAFSSSAPASTNCLLGNFEESLINGRIQPAGVIDGFTAEIGASGSFCPPHLTLPCLAFFFSLSDDSAPSPYLGHVNLESHAKRGYKVPNKGTVQVTLFNPNKSVVKIFVVTYDVSDMPPNHQTLLRQKTVYMPTPGSPSDVQGAPVSLRYLIHLRFASSKQCKIYLHTDIRLIFARDRFELDNRIYHYELRSFTEAPENPKYSPKR